VTQKRLRDRVWAEQEGMANEHARERPGESLGTGKG
jgi:hypothetical protein